MQEDHKIVFVSVVASMYDTYPFAEGNRLPPYLFRRISDSRFTWIHDFEEFFLTESVVGLCHFPLNT